MGETFILSRFDFLKYTLFELKDLGLTGSIYRAAYELGLYSGIYQKYEGTFQSKNRQWQPPISFNEWKTNKKIFFFDGINPNLSTFLKNLPEEEKSQIIKIADKSLQGEILCFSRWFAKYGLPINWHLNPVKNLQWPMDLHWSKAMRFAGGDIKLVWEANRFPQVYYLVRAFHITNEKKYIKGFLDQIRSWSKQNPFLFGVNWASGQELAIRLLAWIFGLYSLYQIDEFNDEDFNLLIKQIYLHTWHIDHNIHYAYYAVHNNHLIGEALALYIVGTLFPFMPDAEKWKKKGKGLLTGKCLEQFYEDGGYCQLSHNYHRLALHYYIWAVRMGELNNDRFPENVYNMLEKSAYFLFQNIEPNTGLLPNWGSNDGALLNPWTCCDYTDFRPIISIIKRLCGQYSPFPRGVWDEESLWFLGNIENCNNQKHSFESISFLPTGIHILRNSDQDFCVFRCGTPPDRFGQSDQLHVDIFFDGKNIICDGGSYLYNDELRFHQYLMGTNSHNTVIVDEQDQMILWRRFKWLYKSEAKLLQFDPINKEVVGEHYGYHRIDKGLTHKRTIKLNSDNVFIKDELKNPSKNSHIFKLHWNLDVEKVDHNTNNKIKSFKIENDNKFYWIFIWTSNNIESERMVIQHGFDENNIVNGWISRYYGEKMKIFSLNFTVNTEESFGINTIISKVELSTDFIEKCEFF